MSSGIHERILESSRGNFHHSGLFFRVGTTVYGLGFVIVPFNCRYSRSANRHRRHTAGAAGIGRLWHPRAVHTRLNRVLIKLILRWRKLAYPRRIFANPFFLVRWTGVHGVDYLLHGC